MKEDILKAIESVSDSNSKSRIPELEDPDIKKAIEKKLKSGATLRQIYKSLSPSIIKVSENKFRTWATESNIIKPRKYNKNK